MKYTLVMLILCAACTFHKDAPKETSQWEGENPLRPSPAMQNPRTLAKQNSTEAPAGKELQKILHWFEQMDAIYRESLWVIRKEKAPQGKSIFGKMQRALLTDMKQKLSNKSLFKCDVYSMKRDVTGLGGVPQNADVFHQCNTKESFVQIGEWNHLKATELTMNFRGGNLSEVLGFATGILSPRIHCDLKSNDNGIIERFNCENLMVDYDPAKNQVLRFTKFEYVKSASSILHLNAEVLENLDPVRKIVVDVPMEGKITVTETVLQAPEYLAKQVPLPTQTPIPSPANGPLEKTVTSNDPESPHEQNQQTRGSRQAPAQQQAQHPEEGFQDGFNNEAGSDQGFPEGRFPPGVQGPPPIQEGEQQQAQPTPQPQPEIPRELNTR